MTLHELARDPEIVEELKRIRPKALYALGPRFAKIVETIHLKLLGNLVDSYLDDCAPDLNQTDLISGRLTKRKQLIRDDIMRISAYSKIPAKVVEQFFKVDRTTVRTRYKE